MLLRWLPSLGTIAYMDILQLIRADLKGATLERQHAVADGAGVPWSTLRKIVDEATANPRYDTVERLRSWYERNPPAPTPTAENVVG